jgi:hypothetical protein
LPSTTQLRFGDNTAGGGDYVALTSPSAVKTTSYTFVLPDSLPPGEDVRLKVDAIAGNVVTLGYTNPNTTGQIGFKGSGANTDLCLNAAFTPVAGITYVVGPSAIYSFETVVSVSENAGGVPQAEIIWGTPVADAVPAGTVVIYYEVQLDANNAGIQGNNFANTINALTAGVAPAVDIFILKGYITTDATVPANTTIQLRARSTNALNCATEWVRITANSSVQLITE